MNIFVKLIAISVAVLFSTQSVANTEAPEIEIVSHKDVLIQSMQVNEVDGQWVVSAKVKLCRNTGPKPWPTSHIDYLVTDQNGRNIAEGAVNYSKKLRHRQLPFLPKFSFTLPESVDSNSKISIGFHEVKPVFDKNLKVAHVENVLR